MSKRVLFGLLTASVVAMWGSEANAFNRINGVVIKHSEWEAEVTLSGFEQDSLLTLVGRTDVEIICEKNGIIEIQKRKVDLNITEQLASFDFNKTEVTLPEKGGFNLSSARCARPFVKVPGSEVLLKFDATTTWKRCNGVEPGPDGIADPNPCFEFRRTVETTMPIEALRTFNCKPGVRDLATGGVPDQELSCTTVQLGPDGIPPP